MSEIALWRAVITQAVNDSRITPEPLPDIPPLSLEEKRAIKALPAEQRKEVREARHLLREERTRILRDHLLKAEAIAWLRDAGPDFTLVCEWADVGPEYVQRKANEINGLSA
jgi:hypothetical protein